MDCYLGQCGKWDEGQIYDFLCQSIKFMVDQAMTDSTMERMGNSMSRGKNGQHKMNNMQKWMENCDMI